MRKPSKNLLALMLALTLMLAFASPALAEPDQTDAPISYSIFASAGAGGKVSPVEVAIYTSGDDGAYAFTPDPGYAVKAIWVDGVKLAEAGGSYTFMNIRADHVIYVEFTEAPDLPATGGGTPNTILLLGLLALVVAACGVMMVRTKKEQ